ncbi:hypothetical protein KPH14_013146 [Odynerus spinipes]|uniref:Uncharacterized protein n=1 Tax=Odynerus spinipes TaxID=1348599 RepID=A0AAD9VIA1_9HYME|nr:hypothetical protein KPH14_013146 [Odynerus spinipes]
MDFDVNDWNRFDSLMRNAGAPEVVGEARNTRYDKVDNRAPVNNGNGGANSSGGGGTQHNSTGATGQVNFSQSPFFDISLRSRYDPRLFVRTGPGRTRLNRSIALLPSEPSRFDSALRDDRTNQMYYSQNVMTRAFLHPLLGDTNNNRSTVNANPEFEITTYFSPVFDISEKLINNYRRSSYESSVFGRGGDPWAARLRKDLVAQLRTIVSHLMLILQDHRTLKLLNDRIVRLNYEIRESNAYLDKYIALSSQVKMDIDEGDRYFHERYALDRLDETVRRFREKNLVGWQSNFTGRARSGRPPNIYLQERRRLQKLQERLTKLQEQRAGLLRRIESDLADYRSHRTRETEERNRVVNSLNSLLTDVFLSQAKDHPELQSREFGDRFAALMNVLIPVYERFREFLIQRDILRSLSIV